MFKGNHSKPFAFYNAIDSTPLARENKRLVLIKNLFIRIYIIYPRCQGQAQGKEKGAFKIGGQEKGKGHGTLSQPPDLTGSYDLDIHLIYFRNHKFIAPKH